MKFERCPLVELYDGVITKMYPFHVSMEGMENKILCREDEDYDTFVKVLAITAHKKCLYNSLLYSIEPYSLCNTIRVL